MREKASEEWDHVDGVADCGPGLRCKVRTRRRTYTRLLEDHGWYLAAADAEAQTDVLMPLPATLCESIGELPNASAEDFEVTD